MIRRFEQRAAAIARRKGLAILLVGLAPMLLRLLLLPILPIPAPRIQDEFSHLLVADTFAHGRLVNPVHPLWPHFESMHILVRPVYASAFPIAQGLIIAVGQTLTGQPWMGVWLSVGLMCASLCWMLQGWVSPGWALLGGVIAAARFGVLSYWMNSYYGGAMAAVGGALVLGAMARIFRRRRWQDSALLGAGLVVLANSRPFEGFVFCAPLMIVLLVWTARHREHGRVVALPLILVVGAAAAGMGVYFARFSGNPFLLPYSFYRNNFTQEPHFLWETPRPEPVYLHRVTRAFYAGWEMEAYRDARANRPPYGVLDKAKDYLRFYVGPILAIPFVTIPWLWRRRRTRILLLTGALVAAALMVEVWNAPHYAAPALGLMLLLAIEGLRHLRLAAGPWPIRGIALASLLLPVVGGGISVGDGRDRLRIQNQVQETGGRHLLLVRYRITHNSGDEWVYNSADIDNAPVVWAREMDPTSNRKLLRYFEGRRIWLVEPDETPVRLSPYDPSMPPDPPFAFVKLGTDAIESLRSPEEIRQKILHKVQREYPPPYRLGCDQWDYLFTELTGVQSPDAAQGCFSGGDRSQLVSFEQWFAWLERQK